MPFIASRSNSELECLKSLAFKEIEDRQQDIHPALQNTCAWLFNNTDYYNWAARKKLNEHNGLLWLKGKPGSGKSTSMKQAFQHAKASASQQHSGTGSVATLAFFF